MCTAEGESVQSRDRDDFACARIAAGLFVAVLILKRAKVENVDLLPSPTTFFVKSKKASSVVLIWACGSPVCGYNHLCNSTDGVDFWCFFLRYHVRFYFPDDTCMSPCMTPCMTRVCHRV